MYAILRLYKYQNGGVAMKGIILLSFVYADAGGDPGGADYFHAQGFAGI